MDNLEKNEIEKPEDVTSDLWKWSVGIVLAVVVIDIVLYVAFTQSMKWTGSRTRQLILMTNASLLIALPLLYALLSPFIHHRFKFFTAFLKVWEEHPWDVVFIFLIYAWVIGLGIYGLCKGSSTKKKQKDQLRPWDSECYCKPGAKRFLTKQIRCQANITTDDSGKTKIAFNLPLPKTNCATCGPDDGKPIYCGK